MTLKKPIIEKITFSPEEQEEIDAIKDSRPAPKQIKAWKARGYNLTRNYNLGNNKRKKKGLQQRFYHGLCLNVHELPDFKIIFDVDGRD
jgi:hypothetical protein